jgi:hypothetical protein
MPNRQRDIVLTTVQQQWASIRQWIEDPTHSGMDLLYAPEIRALALDNSRPSIQRLEQFLYKRHMAGDRIEGWLSSAGGNALALYLSGCILESIAVRANTEFIYTTCKKPEKKSNSFKILTNRKYCSDI